MSKNRQDRASQDDAIVIRKSTLTTVGIALGAFILGGLAGYFVATAALGNRPTEGTENIARALLDDDPFLGPKNAPVTIIEFSYFM